MMSSMRKICEVTTPFYRPDGPVYGTTWGKANGLSGQASLGGGCCVFALWWLPLALVCVGGMISPTYRPDGLVYPVGIFVAYVMLRLSVLLVLCRRRGEAEGGEARWNGICTGVGRVFPVSRCSTRGVRMYLFVFQSGEAQESNPRGGQLSSTGQLLRVCELFSVVRVIFQAKDDGNAEQVYEWGCL